MSKKPRKRQAPKRGTLKARARQGFRGFPVATVAYYGPDNRFASKVAVGIVPMEGGEVTSLKRWFAGEEDVRRDPAIHQEIAAFIGQHGVKSVIMTDRIIGCPHEEGIDYPLGESCPQCPFWADHEPWTGEPTGEKERRAGQAKIVSGCAWYRAEQWERLREISADRDELEESYEDWVAQAEESLQALREAGIDVEKVPVDVEALLAWCQAQGRQVNGEARAEYAVTMMQQRHADPAAEASSGPEDAPG
jgi:hypothetical protein